MTTDRADPDPAQPAGRPARPGVLRWLRYAVGGSLPARSAPWVLHDTTTGTWGLRHVARALVQMAVPIALVVLLVPAPLRIRLMTASAASPSGWSSRSPT